MTRCPTSARFVFWWPSPAWTATIAAPRSWRASLRDAGFEVIYTGIRQTPQMIAEAALQEDVDVVGLSILSGAHMTLCPKVVDLLRAQGQDDVVVVVGGIVPDEDISALKAAGVERRLRPGHLVRKSIVDFIRSQVRVAA